MTPGSQPIAPRNRCLLPAAGWPLSPSRAGLPSGIFSVTVQAMRILIIEDDKEAASYLVKAFREAGHMADHAADGLDGYAMAEAGDYDVLVVDRMLPKLDGLSLIRSLREQKVETPVLILSALGQVDDRVKGLRAGGDDYLPKPYAFSELLARVEVLARRRAIVPSAEPTTYRVGDLELDRLSHRVTRSGQEIVLQPREFRLLEYLMKNANQVVTRTMLLEHVWDYHFDPQTNVIDVHVSRLRAKIDKGFDKPLIHTIRGAGYMVRVGGGEDRARHDGARQTRSHDRVQAVLRVSGGVRALRVRGTGLRGLERAAASRRISSIPPSRPRSTALSEQYRLGGLRRLVNIVERRSRAPGASLYLVTTPLGERVAGNVGALPPGVVDQPGQFETLYNAHRRDRCAAEPCARAGLSACPAGSAFSSAATWRRAAPARVIRRAFGYSLLFIGVLGCAGGWFITRRVLKRIDDMTETTRTIMAGDLSGRLKVAGTGDELDRLAQNLNADARPHRRTDARHARGLGQHRARSQDAADPPAQQGRRGPAPGQDAR